jgi:hypothetical protein
VGNDKRDLFDVLGISTREDSYTTLLANVFNEPGGERWVQNYFEEALTESAPAGPVNVILRLYLRHEHMKKADIPDLVLTFGDPVTDIWLIEAKIKSGESSDQLLRYEKEEVQTKVFTALGLKHQAEVTWHYSYLTLEGDKPTKQTKLEAITYEPLCSILLAEPELGVELLPAYTCMRDRFLVYYGARSEVLNGSSPPDSVPVDEYLLSNDWGLIDEKSRFYWLTRRITEELDMQPALTEAHNPGSSPPVCQMKDSEWQSDLTYGLDDAPLYECYDIHLELQLIREQHRAKLMLHYHTNPYIQGLRNREDIPIEERKIHQERREAFAYALGHRSSEPLKHAGWKLTSPANVNQLAKRVPDFDLGRIIGEFRRWVQEASAAMRPVVNDAAKETIWCLGRRGRSC